MTEPPPRRSTRPLRRSPRHRIGYTDSQDTKRGSSMSRIHSLTSAALAMGGGDDISALTPHRRVPARFEVGPQAARIIAIGVVLVALVVVMSTMIQTPDHVHAQQETVEEETGPAQPRQPPAPVKPEEPSTLTVYVSGAVHQPGVVTIPDSSRIHDAVQAAGGPTEHADMVRINLAARVTDGEHIHVASVGEASTNDASQPASTPASNGIDINTASATELQTVPGIGPATAAAIVQWRDKNGKFAAVDDLTRISGIGEKTIERIRDHVRVGP
ncbi:helix-hairpin-helix domain-containing protein [Arcanobacterium haemolyticum]